VGQASRLQCDSSSQAPAPDNGGTHFRPNFMAVIGAAEGSQQGNAPTRSAGSRIAVVTQNWPALADTFWWASSAPWRRRASSFLSSLSMNPRAGFHNVLSNPNVGLIFFIPGRTDTLRINGKARIVTDAEYFVSDCTLYGPESRALDGLEACSSPTLGIACRRSPGPVKFLFGSIRIGAG